MTSSGKKSTGPSLVMIIRHGEKLGDSSSDKDGGPNLSMRGSARAAALPQLFAPAATPYGCALTSIRNKASPASMKPCRLRVARCGFHAGLYIRDKASDSSNRPVETITPLSAALNLTYDDKHSDSDYAKVASDILTHSQYAGQVVLVCWHQGIFQTWRRPGRDESPQMVRARFSTAFGRLPFRTGRLRWRTALRCCSTAIPAVSPDTLFRNSFVFIAS